WSRALGGRRARRGRDGGGLLGSGGRADFHQPEVTANGQAASMDLACATGCGPALLANIEGRSPLVRAGDVVVFGYRDADEQREYGSQPLPREVRALDLVTIRAVGIARASREAVDHLVRDELAGFFVHLDADVL